MPVPPTSLTTAAPLFGPGEIAALGAAWCWVFTALAFTAAGRRVGATIVNLTRITLACIGLMGIAWIMFGDPLPSITGRSLAFFAVSGVIGLAVGDQLLFSALVDIGPRLATLIATTLAPPVAAVIAWPVLGEAFGGRQFVAMAVILGGVGWVIMERTPAATRQLSAESGRHRLRGILCAVGGGLGQAVGLVLSKLGLGHAAAWNNGDAGTDGIEVVDPWVATLYRMLFALPAMMLIAGFVWRRRRAQQMFGRGTGVAPVARRDMKFILIAAGLIVVGTIFGPMLGVWASMVAVDNAQTGIAATLIATTPIFVIPFAVMLDGERITLRAVLGAVIAVGGVVMLTAWN